MLNADDAITEIRKYLKKLIQVIENDASWTFASTKYIEKNKINDIWVCMEANFPEEYKKVLRGKIEKKLKSITMYHVLKSHIFNKSRIMSSSYAVKYKEALMTIRSFMTNIEQDIRFIYKNL